MVIGTAYKVVMGSGESYERPPDPNLLLMSRRSPFSVIRSEFIDSDGEKKYELWVKCPKWRPHQVATDRQIEHSMSFGKMYCKAFHTLGYRVEYSGGTRRIIEDEYPEMQGAYENTALMFASGVYRGGYRHYPQRPEDRPRIITLDTGATALVNTIEENTIQDFWYFNNNFMQWTYVGGPEKYPEGNFDLYGYIFANFSFDLPIYPHGIAVWQMCVTDQWFGSMKSLDFYLMSHGGEGTGRHYVDGEYRPYPEKFDSPDDYELLTLSEQTGVDFHEGREFYFAEKIAEIRNWEVVFNKTPLENKFYVLLRDKKGKFVRVSKESFGSIVYGKRVTGDMIIDIDE